MWLVSLQTTKEYAEAFALAFEPIASSFSYFEDPSDESIWQVQAITLDKPLEQDILNLLQEVCPTAPAVMIEPLPNKDWLAENRLSFKPLIAGAFYIYASHSTEPLPSDKICLQIDASTAFGTGHHGTTQGCLEALTHLKQQGYTFQKALDVGTGTGILAMATAKLFHVSVIATDNDPQAVQKAHENLLINTCQSQILLLEDSTLTHPQILQNKPFELITANILANTLITLAPDLTHLTTKGSIIILSGILTEQAEHVLNAFSDHGFSAIHTITLNDWATLVVQLI